MNQRGISLMVESLSWAQEMVVRFSHTSLKQDSVMVNTLGSCPFDLGSIPSPVIKVRNLKDKRGEE